MNSLAQDFIILLIVCLFLFGVAQGATIHVPGDAGTIQSGILQANDGDTILVSPGTFSGPGNEAIAFSDRKVFLLSQAGPDQTIILTTDTVRTFVLFDNGDSCVIDGFTISGGYDVPPESNSPFRGGITITNASPIIKNCIIRDCYAKEGGGLSIIGGSPTIIGCRIYHNQAVRRGGGIFSAGTNVSLIDCRIEANTVLGLANLQLASGGGIRNLGGLSLKNCVISSNRVMYQSVTSTDFPLAQGGGIYSLAGDVSIDSCRICHNSAGIGGAAIFGLAETSLMHTLIYNNTADLYGASLLINPPDSAIGNFLIKNCTFACNYSATVSSDGIAIVANPSEPSETWEKPFLFPENRNSFSISTNSEGEIANNIFAFNGSAPLLVQSDAIPLTIANNNLWHTVSGQQYGGALSDQTGVNGNISRDPLFCDISDSGFTIDIASPCLNAGENGETIGAFAVGCDNFQNSLPKETTVTLNASTADSNQTILETALAFCSPWDTLVIRSDNQIAVIDNLTIDKPLYIMGETNNNHPVLKLTEEYNLSSRSVVNLNDFCILQNFSIEATSAPSQILGFTAVKSIDYPVIIRNCSLKAHGNNVAIAAYGNSPLIRNCSLENGLSALGSFDVIASYNFWDCVDYTCVDGSLKIDSVFFTGKIRYMPFLSDSPTAVDEDADAPPSLPVLSVFQNVPNPFNPSTAIRFVLRRSAYTRIEIYNILGECVDEPLARFLTVGPHQLIWNGIDRSGFSVASGIYFCRVVSGNQSKTIKMVLVR